MTITAAPKSTSVGRDLVFGVPLMAAGISCLMLLGLSDARGPVSFPPDDSLYSVQNWLQAAANVVAGLLIAVPKVSRSIKCAAGGVALVSSGLLLGTAIWAMKHWASHRGFIGLDFQRVDKMEQFTVFIALASLVAAVMALSWLASSEALSTHTATHLRRISVISGAITIAAVPPFVALATGNPSSMDATSLGTFALLLSLPCGFAFIFSGYLVPPAALGALATAAFSIGLWTLRAFADFSALGEFTDRGAFVGAGLSFVLLVNVWLITLQWRSGNTGTA